MPKTAPFASQKRYKPLQARKSPTACVGSYSFPSLWRGFDSLHPYFPGNAEKTLFLRGFRSKPKVPVLRAVANHCEKMRPNAEKKRYNPLHFLAGLFSTHHPTRTGNGSPGPPNHA
jgi:hypothetical protein